MKTILNFSRKKKIILLVAVLLLIVASAATAVALTREEMVPIPPLSDVETPQDILLWLEDNRMTEGYGAFYRDGVVYVAARMGMRPTGGYSVKLGNADVDADMITLVAEFVSPAPTDMVNQVITYPYTVVAIDVGRLQPEKVHYYSPGGGVVATVPVQYPADETSD